MKTLGQIDSMEVEETFNTKGKKFQVHLKKIPENTYTHENQCIIK